MLDDRDLGGPSELALVGALLRHDAAEVRRISAQGDVDGRRLVRLVERQRISGVIQHAIADLGVADALPPGATDDLRTKALELWWVGHRLATEMAFLAGPIGRASSSAAFTAGPALSDRLHGDAGRRVQGGIRVLAPWRDVHRIVKALRAEGLQVASTGFGARLLARFRGDSVDLSGPVGVVTVTWALPGMSDRVFHDLLARSEVHEVDGAPIRVPALEDELVVLALRAADDLQRGWGAVRPLADVHAVARRLDGGWPGRFDRWRQAGVHDSAVAILALSASVIGWAGDLPELAEALEPRRRRLGAWGRGLDVDRLRPSKRSARERWRWEALLAGGSSRAVAARARRRVQTSVADAAAHRWRQATSSTVHRLRRLRVDRERRALQTPWATPPAPTREGEIFVSLASFRDPECAQTIEDLFATAAQPDRISVGVLWQVDPDQDHDCSLAGLTRPDQVRIRTVEARASFGVTWARYEAQRLYQGEAFVLQVDSHTRFAPGWDERLIQQLAACSSPRPMLTGYPPGYRIDEPVAPGALHFTLEIIPFTSDDDAIRSHAGAVGDRSGGPVPTTLVAGGFWFASGSVLAEVPYDPYLGYNEEEVSYAIRLFTHGWDLFLPTEPFVYHLYGDDKPKDQLRRSHLTHRDAWDLVGVAERRFDHFIGFLHSDDRRALRELDTFGLGRRRTLEEFEAATGLEIWSRRITAKPTAEVEDEEDDRPLADVLPLVARDTDATALPDQVLDAPG